jgi:hypothetical protein
MTAQE